eukprot:984633-Pyramimonas_sp.AAC.1
MTDQSVAGSAGIYGNPQPPGGQNVGMTRFAAAIQRNGSRHTPKDQKVERSKGRRKESNSSQRQRAETTERPRSRNVSRGPGLALSSPVERQLVEQTERGRRLSIYPRDCSGAQSHTGRGAYAARAANRARGGGIYPAD